MDLSAIRQQLKQRRDDLLVIEKSGDEAAQTVDLDQTRVGRLSRMDAMAQQAVAKETALRRRLALRHIEGALARIEAGEFGDCLQCDEPIAPARLAADPTVTLCIGCAEQAESR